MQARKDAGLTEHSYGVIPIYRRNNETLFLVIQHNAGHWAFPKGRAEKGETHIETARRELREETGIKDVTLNTEHIFEERYFKTKWRDRSKIIEKTVRYYLGDVSNPRVKVQKEEVQDYRWATYEEARDLITFDQGKKLLDQVAQLLKVAGTKDEDAPA